MRFAARSHRSVIMQVGKAGDRTVASVLPPEYGFIRTTGSCQVWAENRQLPRSDTQPDFVAFLARSLGKECPGRRCTNSRSPTECLTQNLMISYSADCFRRPLGRWQYFAMCSTFFRLRGAPQGTARLGPKFIKLSKLGFGLQRSGGSGGGRVCSI